MLKSKFPGKPGGRFQTLRTRVSTGAMLRNRRGSSEAGTSGLRETENIKSGFETFLRFCGDSDEVRVFYLSFKIGHYAVLLTLIFVNFLETS
jgi:hypothetical protein